MQKWVSHMGTASPFGRSLPLLSLSFPHCGRRALDVHYYYWAGQPQPARSTYGQQKSPYGSFFLCFAAEIDRECPEQVKNVLSAAMPHTRNRN